MVAVRSHRLWARRQPVSSAKLERIGAGGHCIRTSVGGATPLRGLSSNTTTWGAGRVKTTTLSSSPETKISRVANRRSSMNASTR